MSDDALVEAVLADIAASPLTGVMMGVEHTVQLANPRALALLGWTGHAGELDWVSITPPEFRTSDDEAMQMVRTRGTTRWWRKVFLGRDGRPRDVELLIVMLHPDPFRWYALVREPELAGSGLRPDQVVSAATPVSMGSALLRLARNLASARSLTDVYLVVDRLVASTLGAAYANVCTLDDDGALLRIHHDPSAPPDVQEAWSELKVDTATLLGTVVRENRSLAVADRDELRARFGSQGVDAERLGLHRLAGAPMRADDGRVIGVLGAGWRTPGAVDLELLEQVASLVANALALAEESDRARAMAAEFRDMLLPRALGAPDGAEVTVRYRAADRAVGGDFYDVITDGDGNGWFVVGDVSGHGLAASRTMGKVRFFIRALVAAADGPSDLLRRVNELLVHEGQHELVTCLVMHWRPHADTVSVASGGHPEAVLVDDTGARLVEVPPGPMLGVLADGSAQLLDDDVVVPINRATRLLLYTDGLVERRDETIDRSIRRLVRLAAATADLDLATALDRLLVRVPSVGEDDIALLGIDLQPSAACAATTSADAVSR